MKGYYYAFLALLVLQSCTLGQVTNSTARLASLAQDIRQLESRITDMESRP